MIIDDIALTLEKGIDENLIAHLIEHFGSAEAIYSAGTERIIRDAEVKPEIAENLVKKRFHKGALEQLKHINKLKINALTPSHPHYPSHLRHSNKPPHVLYATGDTSILTGRLLTMVGTRDISVYGQRACYNFIKGLSDMFDDLVVVSGLAYGVDAECHRAALTLGVPTVAVIKDTLPKISPSGNERLASEIISSGGCIISESNIFTPSFKGEFIKRNRILAGMSEGTLIIEAGHKSGSRATADMAHSFGRTVMAIPGRIDDKNSFGCNELIRSMTANMVLSAWDVAYNLNWEIKDKNTENSKEQEITLNQDQQLIVDNMPLGEVVYMDALSQKTGLDAATLMTELFELDTMEIIRSLPGGRYEKI